MTLEKDRNLAFITHLTGFGNMFIPFGSILIPIIIREAKRGKDSFFDTLTKDIINFNLSYLLYSIVLKLLTIPLFVGSFFTNFFMRTNIFRIDSGIDSLFHFSNLSSLVTIIAIIKFILIIKATIKANKGEYFEYPYTIEFIK